MTDRGVSVTLNYVLGLAIATVLISGLLFAAGDIVGDRQDAAIRSELSVVGERVAASLTTADRLAQSGASTVVLETGGPRSVAGEGYMVSINETSREIVLETTNPAVTVAVPFQNTTPVRTSTANGGDIVIGLSASGELEVKST